MPKHLAICFLAIFDFFGELASANLAMFGYFGSFLMILGHFQYTKKVRIRKYPEMGPRGPKTVIFELPESIEKPVCGVTQESKLKIAYFQPPNI